jgi:soluble cytochrome b562
VPKRELHRFHVQAPLNLRKRRGRKLVIRLGKNTQPSSPQANGDLDSGSVEAPRPPHATALVPVSVKKKKRRLQERSWRWMLLWLGLCSIMGMAVASGVLLLTQLPPPIDCRRISRLSVDGDRLYCAQRAAESGQLEQLVAAIGLVQHWPPQHPLYPEAQRQITAWSKAILGLAQQKIHEGHPSEAIAIATKIPFSSPIYDEAKAKITTWQQQLKRAEEITRQFQDALKVQSFQKASLLILDLSRLTQDSWNLSRVDALLKQLTTERDAWQQLEEARELAKSNILEQLVDAITRTTKINRNTYVKSQVLEEQSRWSRIVIDMATKLFQQQDFAGVIKVLDNIPLTAPQYAEARDWMQLSRASETAKKNNILALVDALAALRPIEQKSPVHKVASSKATLWQQELQDLTKLQLATVFASFQQRTGLTYAIDQASRVAPGRPQRQRSQTLIAQWRKEIQLIDDRNTLANAKQVASGGTIVELKAAVDLARQIKLGQPLRIEAQTEIAKWNRQIYALEDQPILDLASSFAQRGDLIAAISTAGQIRAQRPLYPEAQKAIANWVAQIQTAQDRPILDAAAALAAQGRFDAAIATASQIPPERALYPQAQAAISNWTAQKAAISGEAQ